MNAPHQRIQRERQREAEAGAARGSALSTPRAVFSMIRAGTHSSAMPSRFARRASIVRPVSMQVERRRRAGEPRQPLHAAPAGHDAQHHFGQPEPRAGLVDDDAIAAGERQLEAAAQAEAANERDRRILHRREALERVPAALDERDRAGDVVARSPEFVDVGAGDEAVRLARRDDEALGGSRSSSVERLVQFGEHRGAERVGRSRPALSNVSRARPSASRVRVQCCIAIAF